MEEGALRFLAFIVFSLIACLAVYLSRESLEGVDGSDLVDPLLALVVVITLASFIPFAILWQWRDMATPDQDSPLDDSERRYYDLTVFIIGIGFLALWYLLPYRFIVSWTGQEALPRFASPGESSAFLDSAFDWMSDQGNWHWFVFPIALIALPYSRLVVRTPPFIRSRGRSAEAAVLAAQRGLARGLYSLSLAIQAAVNEATEWIADIALWINRIVSRVVDSGITLFLNLLDVAFRLTALLAICAVGLALLVPGLLTGNLILTALGIVVLTGILLMAILSTLRGEN